MYDEKVGIGTNQAFRKWGGLGGKWPVKARDGGRHVPGVPNVERRHRVEADKAVNAVGRIQRKSVTYPRTAVVRDDSEPVVPELRLTDSASIRDVLLFPYMRREG